MFKIFLCNFAFEHAFHLIIFISVGKTEEKADKQELSKEDFDDLEDAIENIAHEKKKLLIEKEEIEDLKEEMAEYKEVCNIFRSHLLYISYRFL